MKGVLGLALLVLFAAAPSLAGRAVVDWQYDYVNVRSAPSTDAAAVGRLAIGAETETLEERGEWTRIRYPGGVGWVVSRSLRAQPAVEAAAAPAPPPPPSTREQDPEARTAPPASEASSSAPAEAPPPQAPERQPAGDRSGYLSEYLDTPTAPSTDTGTGLVRMVSGLLLVLALLGAVGYAVRRLGARRLAGDRRGGAIRVLATRSLGPRTGLVLVEVEGLVWLLAQGPDGVTPVAEIREAETLRRLNERYGFLEAPFEAELRRQLEPEVDETAPDAPGPAPTPEERLAALRRRPGAGDTP